MELKTIALIAAIFMGGTWAAVFFFGIIAQGGLFGLFLAVPAALLAYILVCIIGGQSKGDIYDDIEQ